MNKKTLQTQIKSFETYLVWWRWTQQQRREGHKNAATDWWEGRQKMN